MIAVMENIRQLSGQQAELKSLKDRLNSKIDVILFEAAQIGAGGQITVLQNAIGELIIRPSYTFAGNIGLKHFLCPSLPVLIVPTLKSLFLQLLFC